MVTVQVEDGNALKLSTRKEVLGGAVYGLGVGREKSTELGRPPLEMINWPFPNNRLEGVTSKPGCLTEGTAAVELLRQTWFPLKLVSKYRPRIWGTNVLLTHLMVQRVIPVPGS